MPADRALLFRRFDAWDAAAAIAFARVLYLILACPYELAADEAQYWDWSRHLELSYYSKGPGIAWLIAASTSLLGDAEGAIRLPATLCIFVTTLAIMRLARRAGGALPRTPAAALLAFCCIPAYHASALLMTIDAPYLACWAIASLAAWSIVEHARARTDSLTPWLAFAAAVGIGFLFKYTILLILPGVLLAAWFERPRPRMSPRAVSAAAALFLLITSPVILWNARHGWPTLAHLLGHLGAPGGDTTSVSTPWAYNPRWTLEFLGAQLGLVGPLLLLAGLSIRRAHRSRAAIPDDWRASRFALCLAAPILLFYFAISLATDVEGNWPIAGYLTLLVPVALAAARGLADAKGLFRTAWHWSIGYGVVAALALFTLQWLDRIPRLTNVIPYHRISGHREFAVSVDTLVRARTPPVEQPGFIADQYTRAALLAYYLPGQPRVASATSFLGGRRSAYDFFHDTSLHRPDLLGRDAVLIGSTPQRWSAAFTFDRVDLLLDRAERRPAVYCGVNYRGPTP
jgi:hypothetical protein